MVPAKLRFHCAARLDPVTPIIVKAALTGWEAKQGQVDLAIERSFKAQELVLRMKWRITADAKKATKVVKRRMVSSTCLMKTRSCCGNGKRKGL